MLKFKAGMHKSLFLLLANLLAAQEKFFVEFDEKHYIVNLNGLEGI